MARQHTITTLTPFQAERLRCPSTQLAHNCMGDNCMAWQWAEAANVTAHTLLRPEHGDMQWQYFTDEAEYADRGGVAAIPDLEQEHFQAPTGDGWAYTGITPDPEDGWMGCWNRRTDDGRKGYCALLAHPLAVAAKLDALSDAVLEGGDK